MSFLKPLSISSWLSETKERSYFPVKQKVVFLPPGQQVSPWLLFLYCILLVDLWLEISLSFPIPTGISDGIINYSITDVFLCLFVLKMSLLVYFLLVIFPTFWWKHILFILLCDIVTSFIREHYNWKLQDRDTEFWPFCLSCQTNLLSKDFFCLFYSQLAAILSSFC